MSTTTQAGTSSVKTLYEGAECFQVAGDTIASAWPDLEPFVFKWVTVSDGKLQPQDVFKLISEGLMTALVIHTEGEIHIVALTEFVQYPQAKTLRLVGFAGKNPLLTLKFMPAVEDWARANGCDELETFTTHRAKALMERMGFEDAPFVYMRKCLFNLH
ncbi:hypothetical protein [Methylocaldum sp.]|uniref:hypothetical protein n=1 Tax=Methylocaldum sp. TaxID=1969727 RepID=UPI002D5E141C|nr:hypothetical protein [Methylocaldum sp.]HYE38159.1 hypothetical protein [Methylocaldum sp.]